MHAIITDGSISKYINHPKPLVIGDVRYPARIFSVWTANELAAIGIIEVTFDDSKKKDEQWYINTNQTYTYDADAGTVTATYGDAFCYMGLLEMLLVILLAKSNIRNIESLNALLRRLIYLRKQGNDMEIARLEHNNPQ